MLAWIASIINNINKGGSREYKSAGGSYKAKANRAEAGKIKTQEDKKSETSRKIQIGRLVHECDVFNWD
jgi:hypothetical protein